MKRFTCVYTWLLCLVFSVAAQEKVAKLRIVQASDVHGNYYPYNLITCKDWQGSLARIYAFVEKEREQYEENLILLDNDDILQGQPIAYYHNYIDTVPPYLCAEMTNYMKYDAGNMGNHNVETGRVVPDRWINTCDFPVLGANTIDTSTGEPHLPPHKVMERDGVKIVILGMIALAISAWLSEDLWEGLCFDDMEETACKRMKIIREKGNPGLMIGLFHAGQKVFKMSGKYNENASLSVAKNVPGFGIVLTGYNHVRKCKKVTNMVGDSVLVIDPINNGIVLPSIDATLKLKDGKVHSKGIKGVLTKTKDYGISEDFMKHSIPQYDAIRSSASKKIGIFIESISTCPSFSGPSASIDSVHTLQLDTTGAEISSATPLSLDTKINKGDVFVSDMFNLYKYENILYTMALFGKEIKDYLEMPYFMRTNRVRSPDDHLFWFKEKCREGAEDRASFQNFSLSFDSALETIYTVNVTKPQGEKITVASIADGSPFFVDKIYKVALNFYRRNSDGELLTKGSGIPQEKLKERIIFSTDKDFCFYLTNYIENKGIMDPEALNQWKFVPEKRTVPATERDYKFLFGDSQ